MHMCAHMTIAHDCVIGYLPTEEKHVWMAVIAFILQNVKSIKCSIVAMSVYRKQFTGTIISIRRLTSDLRLDIITSTRLLWKFSGNSLVLVTFTALEHTQIHIQMPPQTACYELHCIVLYVKSLAVCEPWRPKAYKPIREKKQSSERRG